MKILFVTNWMEVGGIETNLIGLSRSLGRRGHEVWVASSGGVLVSDLEQTGARHVRLPLNLWHPARLAWAAPRLHKLVRRERFQVVHALSAAANAAVALATRKGSAPCFVSSPMGLQNSEDELPAVTLLRNWLLVARTDKVLLISEEIEREVRKVPLVDSRLLKCNIVGVDASVFGAREGGPGIRREFGIDDNAPLITTIGALHPRKSHDLFIAAAARVLGVRPDARFMIVGDGPLQGALEQQANSLGVSPSLIFAGRRKDVPAIMAATTVYIKPGVVEGFVGITVLEAMAAGVPVVAFTTKDVQAAIIPGESGLLVPPHDTQAMADAILGLLADPHRAGELAKRGAALVADRFSFEQIAARLEHTYADIERALGHVQAAA